MGTVDTSTLLDPTLPHRPAQYHIVVFATHWSHWAWEEAHFPPWHILSHCLSQAQGNNMLGVQSSSRLDVQSDENCFADTHIDPREHRLWAQLCEILCSKRIPSASLAVDLKHYTQFLLLYLAFHEKICGYLFSLSLYKYQDNVSNFSWFSNSNAWSLYALCLSRTKFADPWSMWRLVPQQCKNQMTGQRRLAKKEWSRTKRRCLNAHNKSRSECHQCDWNSSRMLESTQSAMSSCMSLNAPFFTFIAFPKDRTPPHQVIGSIWQQ